VYLLQGGLEEWKDAILFPTLPAGATPAEEFTFEKRKKVSMFFGGTPQTGAAEGNVPPAIVMPKMEQPAGASAAPAAGTPKKKKKEGC
jgi:hypothetical protein